MANKTFTASLYTLGCRVNQYESEAVRDKLVENGFEIKDFDDVCDIYIINTCTVTRESERKCRQYIRRAKTINPKGHIIIMGCMAQNHTDELEISNLASYICGNRNKMSVVDAAIALCNGENQVESSIVNLDEYPYEKMEVLHSDNTRAYVKIEDGCDNNCSYCAIRFARGPVVSRPIDEVVDEVKRLAKEGYKEVVLTGVETASYGKDTGETLEKLVRAVHDIDGIERIRFGSLEPSSISLAFIEAMASLKKVMPSYHLSLQSGSSRVLAMMKRKYNSEQAMSVIDSLRRAIPNVTFSCDIIAGFPGETHDDSLETCEFVEKARFLHCHIFPYSKREGTLAAKMEHQHSHAVKSSRANSIKHTAQRIAAQIYTSILPGTEFDVLFESPKNGVQIGHTPELFEVRVECPGSLQGEIRKVKVISSEKDFVFGELI